MKVKTGLGQDSHKFENNLEKPLILAGVLFPDERGLAANSDGDVIFHALTNAISSITTVNILGSEADKLCEKGITDSSVYNQPTNSSFQSRKNYSSTSFKDLDILIYYLYICIED